MVEGVLDLRAVEARHPATVTLAAGEHHSQDVRERIQAHVDVAALLEHCRALRVALQGVMAAPVSGDSATIRHRDAAYARAAAVLGAAQDQPFDPSPG